MGEKERTVQQRPAHNLIMENRHILSLSGVLDVDSFAEQTVILSTELGGLTIKGLKLHISRFDQQTCELTMDGEIDEIIYTDSTEEPQGFFARLFS